MEDVLKLYNKIEYPDVYLKEKLNYNLQSKILVSAFEGILSITQPLFHIYNYKTPIRAARNGSSVRVSKLRKQEAVATLEELLTLSGMLKIRSNIFKITIIEPLCNL